MKILKTILLAVLAIIVVTLIAAAFLPKDYGIAESIVINKPRNEVFAYIQYLKNQDNYSKWALADPNMKKEYRGTDGQPGFVSAWESDADSVGKGEQEILSIVPNDRVEYELRFIEPFESKEKAYMKTEDTPDGATKLTWGFDGHMNYPMNLMLAFMNIEEMISNDLRTGLQRLKPIVEAIPSAPPPPMPDTSATH